MAERLAGRVGRVIAVGVPLWILVFWGLALTRMIPGAAFILSSIIATVLTIGADWMMQGSRRLRRALPIVGLSLTAAWIVILPIANGDWG